MIGEKEGHDGLTNNDSNHADTGRNRASNIIAELRSGNYITIVRWSGRSVSWLILGKQTFSMTVENFKDTSH